MNRRYLLLVMLLLPLQAGAEWVLQQSNDGHWVAGQNRQHHQLIITQHENQKSILLILSLADKRIRVPHSAKFIIDQVDLGEYPLEVRKKRPNDVALLLALNQTDQDSLFTQLVNGLNLTIQFDKKTDIQFSLAGFTNTFSDFLIANDVGRLDPHWLQMQGYRKELTCYEIARALVSAMQMRKAGKTITETELALHEQLSEEASAALADIIDQTYSVPASRLPRIPSTRKYAFFRQCMQKMR